MIVMAEALRRGSVTAMAMSAIVPMNAGEMRLMIVRALAMAMRS